MVRRRRARCVPHNGAAFDIMTAAGCVSDAPPIFKIHHDRVAQRGIEASAGRLLYATFSMFDTVRGTLGSEDRSP
jgi:hypothetical protein